MFCFIPIVILGIVTETTTNFNTNWISSKENWTELYAVLSKPNSTWFIFPSGVSKGIEISNVDYIKLSIQKKMT